MRFFTLLVVFFITAPFHCHGQYEPFLQEGKLWNLLYHNPFTGEEYNTQLTINGDTIVNGHLCKKVYENNASQVKAFLFEDGKKVLRCWLGREDPELLYDFGCEVGDVVTLSYCKVLVTKIDTVEQRGHMLRRIAYSVAYDDDEYFEDHGYCWVEGVGSSADMLSNMELPGNYYNFRSCELDGEVLYDYKVFYADAVHTGIQPSEDWYTEYVPFVEEGKVWYCGYGLGDGTVSPEDPHGAGIACIFTMSGDTLIGGQSYKKVVCQYEDFYGDKEQHYYCAVREESYRVFLIEAGDKDEKLLYDFSAPRETLIMAYNDYRFARVPDGHPYFCPTRQVEFMLCELSGDEVQLSNGLGLWFEGVGAIVINPFACELYINDKPKIGRWVRVETCMINGKYRFQMGWLAAPTSVDSKRMKAVSSDNIYDLQGRCLSNTKRSNSQMLKGVYIQNGRKVIR